MTAKELWHKYYIDPRRRRKLHRHGVEALQLLDRAMTEAGRPYTLAYGTLLGAVREHGFIAHDCDIDIALWADEDYSPVWEKLKGSGFRLTRQILVDGGEYAREDSWKYKSISIDFLYFFPDEGDIWQRSEFRNQDGCSTWKESIAKAGGLKVLQVHLPLSKETEYVPFESIEEPVTKSALAFIEEYYGKNWRTPDPGFTYPRLGETRYEEPEGKVGKIINY